MARLGFRVTIPRFLLLSLYFDLIKSFTGSKDVKDYLILFDIGDINITSAFEGRFVTLVLRDGEYSADWGSEEMPNGAPQG